MSKNNLFGMIMQFASQGLSECFKEYDVNSAYEDYVTVDKTNISELSRLQDKMLCLLMKTDPKDDQSKLCELLIKIGDDIDHLEHTVGV